MTANPMTETQAVNLVRNALLAAGHEMGKDGDHWPVIKSTVYSIVKDHEDWQIEKNVSAEVKKHFEDLIKQLQGLAKTCPVESRPRVNSTLAELLDIYSASYSPANDAELEITDEDYAPHLRRADAIIQTLEEDNA